MYTTTDNIESKLGASLTTAQKSYFTNVLSRAISKYIDTQTGTTFGSRKIVDVYIDGEDNFQGIIPTMHTITGIYNVDSGDTATLIDASAYNFYPRGSDQVYAIRNINGTWAEGLDNIKITGMLGYKNVPDDITLVATELAVNALNDNSTGYKSEKVGDWSATYADIQKSISTESTAILRSYNRLSRRI